MMMNTSPLTETQPLIDQRLDALDRALLGLLPRNDRLAMVAQVEARICELVANPAHASGAAEFSAASDAGFSGAAQGPVSPLTTPSAFATAACGWTSRTGSNWTMGKKRSRLALSAGLLGIVALVLLFVTPVTYLTASFLGDTVGEIAAYSLLGVHLAAVTTGGLVAVALAIAALISLKRRRNSLAGHGWAITGLCTGPLPMLAGGATALFFSFQLLGSQFFAVQTVTSEDACPTECQPPSYLPAPVQPLNAPASTLVGVYGEGPAEAYHPAPASGPPQSPFQTVGREIPEATLSDPDTGALDRVPTEPGSLPDQPRTKPSESGARPDTDDLPPVREPRAEEDSASPVESAPGAPRREGAGE